MVDRGGRVKIITMSMTSLISLIRRARLVLAVVSLQAGNAGLTILSIFALNQGMNLHTFIVYRMTTATLIIAPFAIIFDRNSRPRMTFSIAAKILLLSLDPVLTGNLYYLGLKNSTATFSSAMSNILPAFAFLTAWIFRLEKVNFKSLDGLAKVLGTLITVGGAIILTLLKGPSLSLPWAKEQHPDHHRHQPSDSHSDDKNLARGALFMSAACLSWSVFIVLQTYVLRSYPCQLSLTALICFWSTVEATVLALVMEWRNSAAWSINLDVKLLTAVYGGILSGIAYCVLGVVVKEKGPVFVSAFHPLGTVMVAILGSLVLAEQMYLWSLIGAIIIIIGLYMILWGKTKDQPPSQSQEQRENGNDLPKIGD